MRADSIRARGPKTLPYDDAGYMAATSPSADQQVPSSNAGRTIYVSRARRLAGTKKPENSAVR